MKELLTNEVIITAGVGFLIAVLGMFLTRKKLYEKGLFLSQLLNKKIGVRLTQWLEDKLQELLDGMKADNSKDRK